MVDCFRIKDSKEKTWEKCTANVLVSTNRFQACGHRLDMQEASCKLTFLSNVLSIPAVCLNNS